jgi:DNA-binding NtrC family response regulator
VESKRQEGEFRLRSNSTLRAVNGDDVLSAHAPAEKNRRGEIMKLNELSAALAIAANALELAGDRDVRFGLDFYEEVRRFETTLIKQALKYTGGVQIKAAKLLRLNLTTLNTKIKRYDITIP